MIQAARAAVMEYVEADSRVVCAFVGGSAARGEADSFSDVDLRVFLAEPPLPPPRFEMRGAAPLEWKFLLWDEFQEIERAFQRPFFSEEIADAVPLYDPHGKLSPLIQAAQDPARRADPQARAQTLLNAAFQQADEAADSAFPLWNIRCALFWSGQAAALILCRPPAHRHLLANLRTADAPLYETKLKTLGAQAWSRSDALKAAECALAAAVSLPPERTEGMPYLSRDRVELWRGFFHHSMREDDNADARTASLPVWTIAAQISLVDARLPQTQRLRDAAVQLYDGAGEAQIERLGAWLETLQRRLRHP